MGFSAIGPIGGIIAAGWQASLGSVASGSLFSFLQSAAMGRAAAGVITAIRMVGAGVAVAGVLMAGKQKVTGLLERIGSWFWKKKED